MHSREGNPPSLAEGAHLWLVSLTGNAPDGAAANLLPEERERCRRFSSPERRRQAELARSALRTILGSYLGCAPLEVPLAREPDGKPYLAAGPGNLEFNVSHTRDVGLIGVTRKGPIGVDLEGLRACRNAAGIASSLFSPSAAAQVEQLPEPHRTRAFLTFWTRREAYLKVLGRPLFESGEESPELPALDIYRALSDSRPATVPCGVYRVRTWLLRGNHVVSVALPAGDRVVRWFEHRWREGSVESHREEKTGFGAPLRQAGPKRQTAARPVRGTAAVEVRPR